MKAILTLFVLGCLVLTTSWQSVSCVPLPEFFPFGPDYGDIELEQGNDVSVTVTLQQSIPYLGLDRDTITVETDGELELTSISGSAFIYPFSADADTTSIGHVFYRESTDAQILSRINSYTDMVFDNSTNLTYAFIATWFYVGYFDNHDDRTNSFQCVIATDGSRTFVALLYADNLIQWMTGDSDGGMGGLGGDRADVGFIGDDPTDVFYLPASNTSAVLELDSTSNVARDGIWLFEVGSTVTLPMIDECAVGLDNCDMDAQCVDLPMSFTCICLPGFTGDGLVCMSTESMSGSGSASASGSASGSGSGSGFFGSGSGSGSGVPIEGSCVEAGFMSCCVEPTDNSTDCRLSFGADSCSCDQHCFQFGDCCPDILEAQCFPEITIGFTVNETTVVEGDIVVYLDVNVTGFFPDPVLNFTSFFVFYTRDGSAEAPTDYEGTIRIIEFSEAGIQRVPVTIVDDLVLEDTEYFSAHITASDMFVVTTIEDVTIFITDNDVVEVGLAEVVYSVSESSLSVEVCVSLLSDPILLGEIPVEVQLSTQDDSALSAEDYLSVNETILFSPGGSVEECVNVSILTDVIVEEEETFLVGVISDSPRVMINASLASATVFIQDASNVTIGLESVVYNAPEADGQVGVCAVVTAGQLGREVNVTLETQESLNAEDGPDYTGGSIVLSFSELVQRACYNISIAMDGLVELTESFEVTLLTNDSAVWLDNDQAFVVILDSDGPVVVSLEENLYYVNETDGSVEICVIVIEGTPDSPFTVELSFNGDTAVLLSPLDASVSVVNGSDFDGNTQVLQFNETDSRVCATVDVLFDGLVESEETFNVFLSSQDPRVAENETDAQVVILDNDSVTISLEQSLYSVSESEGSVEVCAVVSQGELARDVIVELRTEGGTATSVMDFGPELVNLTFSDQVSRQCVNISIVQDGINEVFETFNVILDSLDPSVSLNISMSPVIISDSDAVTISLEQSLYSVSESEGSVEVCAFVSQGQLAQFVSIQLSTSDGSALSNSDYDGVAIALPFSDTLTRQCVNITIFQDGLLESDETFTVNLINFSPNVELGISSAAVTISDSDSVTISLEQSLYSVSEAEGSVEVCAVVSQGQLARDVIVELRTEDGTAISGLDFGPELVNLTFSNQVSRQCVNISIVQDGIDEALEAFNVIIESADSALSLNNTPAQVVILDSDSVTISLEQSSYAVSEDAGSVEVCAFVSQGQLARDVIVELRTEDSTATSVMDFGPELVNLTFSDQVSRQCVNISIVQDGVLESLEAFDVNIESTDPAVSLGVSSALVLITDIDTVTISLEQSLYSVSEDAGSVEVCAFVSQGQLAREVIVELSTEEGTATSGLDYGNISTVLTFSDQVSRQCVNISIVQDGIDETLEAFNVIIESTDPAVSLGVSSATVLITDIDTVTISLEQSSYSVSEAEGNVEVCAVVSQGQLAQFVSIQLSTSDGSALSNSDYDGVAIALPFSGTLTRQCVNITIFQDGLLESDETFTVNLINFSPNVELGISSAAVTISDSDSVTISLEQSLYSVSESEGRVEVCAVVSQGQLARDVIVELRTEGGTATSGLDFGPELVNLTFSDQVSRQCVNISIVQDGVLEALEAFNVAIESADPAVSLGVSSASILISDNDAVTISLEQSSYAVSEAEGSVEVCAVVSQGQLAREVIVDLRAEDVTATSGLDYGNISTVLTFSDRVSRQCVNISIVQDGIDEPLEAFSVNIESADPAVSLGVSSATVVISDSDAVTISLEQSLYSVSEAEGSVEVCAFVSQGQLAREVIVELRTEGGTATSGLDYGNISTVFTFSDQVSRHCVNISIVQDGIDETLEAFNVIIESTDPAVSLGVSSATVLITDIDTVTISLEQSSYSVSEAEGNVEVCAVVSQGLLAQFVSIQLSTSDGSALSNSDYDGVAIALPFSGTLTRQCVNITIFQDGLLESDETFTVNLINFSPNVELGISSAAVTISDSDSVTISLEQSSYAVSEDEGSVEVCAVVSQGQLARDVIVELRTEGGTATSVMDFGPELVNLTFSDQVNRQCVNISIVQDGVLEALEAFNVAIESAHPAVSLGVSSATVLISDSDAVTISLEQSSYAVSEAEGSVEVCAVVSQGQLAREVIVELRTEGGTATSGLDFGPELVNLTFSNQVSRQCVNISIVQDGIDETLEAFNVIIESTDPAVSLGVSSATVLISDSDAVTISLEQSLYSVSEDAGSVEVCAFVSQGQLARDVIVELRTEGGTATSGLDFGPELVNLTFSDQVSRQCVNISIVQDGIDETLEAFNVIIESTDPAVSLGVSSATVLITDIDTVTISLEQSLYSVSEAERSVEVCAFVSQGQLSQFISVQLSTVSGTALSNSDYDGVAIALPFSDTLTRQCVNITIFQDGLLESDETFTVNLINFSPNVELGISSAAVTISDSDSVIISLEQTSYTVSESEGSVEVCAVVSQGQLARDATVTLSTSEISAVSGIDYSGPPVALTFTPGSNRQCRQITVILDGVVESTESFSIAITTSDPDVTLVGSSGTVFIEDSDTVQISFDQQTYSVSEGNGFVEVCLNVAGSSLDRSVTAELSTQEIPLSATGSSDFVPTDFNVTFSQSPSQICVNILILDDSVPEGDESFNVALLFPAPLGVIYSSPTVATVVIGDNDAVADCEFEFIQSSYSGTEDSDFFSVCVQLNGVTTTSTSLLFSTRDGTALAGSDYDMTTERVTFGPSPFGISVSCPRVRFIEDSLPEPDEVFFVDLSDPQGGCSIATPSTTVTILADVVVEPVITFEQLQYSVSEAGGSIDVCVTINPLPLPGQTVSADYATADLTALAGDDYEDKTGTLTFTSTSGSRQCVNIGIVDDSVFELEESFQVSLVQGAQSQVATVTIGDDDPFPEPLITFEQLQYSVSEAGGSIDVCVTINPLPLPGQTVSADYATTDLTALAGDDYEDKTGTLTFTSTSGSRQCVNIGIVDDSVFELEESFQVSLVQGAQSQVATVTIGDDDPFPDILVNPEQLSYNVLESSGQVSVCVVAASVPAAGQFVVVDYQTSSGTALAGQDFNTVVGSLTFTSGSSLTMCVNIPIVNDGTPESSESFSVTFSQTLSNGPRQVVVSVNIQDDDAVADCEFEFIQSSYSGTEDSDFFSVCVQLNGVTTTSTSLLFSTRDGTALAGSDYDMATERVTFGPSPFGISVSCPRVRFIEDSLPEPDEVFFVDLSDPQGGCSIATPSTTVTILADVVVEPVITFEQLQYSVSEAGGSIDVCVTINPLPLPGQTVSADYATADLTALAGDDYEDKTGTLTFTSTSGSRQCVNIGIVDDSVFELEESFQVSLVQGAQSQVATVTIGDDDPLATTISLEQTQYSLSEEGGSLEVCLVLSGQDLLEPANILVFSSGGTATAGLDYTQMSITLQFVPGGPRRICTAVVILDDSLQEGSENFNINLFSSDFSGTLGPSALFTIIDTVDGTLVVTLEQTSYTYAENENPQLTRVCVDLIDNAVNRPIDIFLNLRDGSAIAGQDYVSETAMIRFDPVLAETVMCVFLNLIDDVVPEPTEQFFADLSTSDPAVRFQIQTTTIVILDNDPVAPVIEVGFTSSSYSVLEGELPPASPSFVSVCVSISGDFSGQLDFQVSTQDIGSAVDGLDYVGGPRVLSFVAGGPTIQCTEYTVLGDNLIEGNEQFAVSVVSLSSTPVTISPSAAIVSIVEDDLSPEIVLINDTPEVNLETGGLASVRADFTLRADVASASCQLFDLFGPTECTSGTVTFSGIDPTRQEPFTLIVTAFDAQGEVLANITRQVRLGLNLDCAVNFVNAGEEDVVIVDGAGFVRIEWEEVGPVQLTECRLEVNGVRGDYQTCMSPYILGNLAPGSYAVKVRPDGSSCTRRIRRTVMFVVE